MAEPRPARSAGPDPPGLADVTSARIASCAACSRMIRGTAAGTGTAARSGDPVQRPRLDRRHDRRRPARPAARHRARRAARPDRPAAGCRGRPMPRSAIASTARSPAAAWAPCSRAATPTSAATWPSRSCSRTHRDKPDLVRRFIEEAQIGGQLQHPGIVPIYELGTFADRRPYFAMKLVKGRTLAELLDGPGRPGRRPAAVPGDLRGHLPDGGLRPRPGRDPPRPEAVERDGRHVRRGPGDGLGPGQGPAPRRGRRRRRRPAEPASGDGHRHGPERLGRADLSQAGSVMGTPRTWRPSRPGARSTGSTSGPTSSPWARSSARS